MNAIHRRRPGHWADRPNPSAYKPADGEPSIWKVIGLGLSPLFVIGAVSLIAVAITNWK